MTVRSADVGRRTGIAAAAIEEKKLFSIIRFAGQQMNGNLGNVTGVIENAWVSQFRGHCR